MDRDREGGGVGSTGSFITLGLEEANSTVPSMAGKIQCYDYKRSGSILLLISSWPSPNPHDSLALERGGLEGHHRADPSTHLARKA